MLGKSLLCLLLVCAISTNAQGLGFFGFGYGVDFYSIALQSAATKLTAQNLPEDLQTRVDDVLANGALALLNCQTGAFWQYIRCQALELKNSMTELKAIENEFTARNTTPASPSVGDTAAAPSVSAT